MMFGYLIPDKPEDVKLAEKRDKVTIEELADDEDPHPWDSFQENAKAHREMKFRMAQVCDCQVSAVDISHGWSHGWHTACPEESRL